MKDAQGHGSNGSGASVLAPAAHQTGVAQIQPSLSEGRELYASLMAHAQSVKNANTARAIRRAPPPADTTVDGAGRI